MNILFVASLDFPEGLGGTRRFYDIFGKLFTQGHSVDLVNVEVDKKFASIKDFFRFRWRLTRDEEEGITLHNLNREISILTSPILTAGYLKRVIKERNIDVLILGMPEPFTGIPSLMAAKLTKTPFVIDYPDSHYRTADLESLSRFGRFARYVEKILPRYADTVFPISQTMNNQLLAQYRTPRHVITPGIQFDKISSGKYSDDLVPEGFVIGYTGSYATREGVGELIDAFESLEDDLSDLRLVLAGGRRGPNADFVEQRVTGSLGDRVHEVEFIDHDDIPDFLASCDILCAPQWDTFAHRVAFSTKVCEYLASGTPVITTPVGDLGNILKDESNAKIVRPRNSDEISEAIHRLRDDPQLRTRIGERGQRLAGERFNAATKRVEVEEILTNILADEQFESH